MKLKDQVNRRKLLENASAMILLGPLMRALGESQVFGATVNGPIGIFFYYGSGSHRDNYWPTGDANGIGTFAPITKPLEAHKESLTFIRGMSHKAGDNHYGGPKEVLAGGGDNLYSIDQMLADQFGGNSLKKSIALGTFTNAPGTHDISFKKGGMGNRAMDNPKAAYEDIFGGFTPTANLLGSSGLALANDQVLSGRRRMLDIVRGDMAKIKGKLGPIEARIFERHVTSLDELYKDVKDVEDRAKGMMPSPGPTPNPNPNPSTPTPNPTTNSGGMAKCDPASLRNAMPTGAGNNWFYLPELNPTINEFNRRMMIEALACGITRFAVMQYGHSECLGVINFKDVKQVSASMHGISHAGSGDGEQIALHSGVMHQVSQTISALKALKLGDKSLFDQTLILTSTCIGDQPNEHVGAGIPTFLAGNLGGKLKGNRVLTFPYQSTSSASGIPYNQVLVSFAQLMGLNVNRIGGAGEGPIPGLV